MAKLADRLDAYQRRHPTLGLPLGVLYKFFDDQGNYQAAILTYYGFIAIFPLLLTASSILGFVLQSDVSLKNELLNSALRQFPIVGTQLGQPEGLRGSTPAIIGGTIVALYGAAGLGQATQNAINVALAVPRNSRVNPIVARLRSLVLLLGGGLTVLTIAVLSSLASQPGGFGIHVGSSLAWILRISSAVLTAFVLGAMVRFASSRRLTIRQVIPGAAVVAVLWQLLQDVGGIYVEHVVKKASAMNSTFALVLGLVALMYLAATIAVLGLEINVVLAERLYPRALLTPFTDEVQLTEADRRAYARYAQAQRHKGFERITVEFDQPDEQPPPS
ncbi:MAG: YihY/virulence factor BrkB family protein [Marmoricola sp.]